MSEFPKAHAKRILQDWIEDEAHAESLKHWPDLHEAFEWLRSVAESPSNETCVVSVENAT